MWFWVCCCFIPINLSMDVLNIRSDYVKVHLHLFDLLTIYLPMWIVCHCLRWNKLVQKPFEEGDGRGLKLVQSILRPIMLRRTKHTTDKEGRSALDQLLAIDDFLHFLNLFLPFSFLRPILVLPPADVQVIYCELTEAERDFYEALFKRSKVLYFLFALLFLILGLTFLCLFSMTLLLSCQVKFDQFVQQGRVLHNYASILELLLRLRQCCDHPFLVMRLALNYLSWKCFYDNCIFLGFSLGVRERYLLP